MRKGEAIRRPRRRVPRHRSSRGCSRCCSVNSPGAFVDPSRVPDGGLAGTLERGSHASVGTFRGVRARHKVLAWSGVPRGQVTTHRQPSVDGAGRRCSGFTHALERKGLVPRISLELIRFPVGLCEPAMRRAGWMSRLVAGRPGEFRCDAHDHVVGLHPRLLPVELQGGSPPSPSLLR